MYIRKAVIQDIPAIMDLVNQAKSYMLDNGIDQWQKGYPNESTFYKDIESEHSFILCDDQDEVLATAAILFSDDPNYQVIEGQWLNDQPYGVIHRIVVNNTYKGKGLAGLLIKYAEELALEQNIYNLRIDTHEKNKSMQSLILKHGFKVCGVVLMQDLSPRFAFQKRLDFMEL